MRCHKMQLRASERERKRRETPRDWMDRVHLSSIISKSTLVVYFLALQRPEVLIRKRIFVKTYLFSRLETLIFMRDNIRELDTRTITHSKEAAIKTRIEDNVERPFD